MKTKTFTHIAVTALLLIPQFGFGQKATQKPGIRGGRVTCADGSHKRLVAVERNNAPAYFTVRYEYDNSTGLLKSIDDYVILTITYNPFEMFYEENFEDERWTKKMSGIQQDSEGNFLSLTATEKNESPNYSDETKYICKFHYDNDKHLVEMNTEAFDNDGIKVSNYDYKLTWENGLLMKFERSYNEYGDISNLAVTYKYGDGNANATRQFSSACFPYEEMFLLMENNSFQYAGFVGAGPDRLPTSAEAVECSEESGYVETYERSYKFSHTFNADGTVATSTISEQGGESATTETFTFKYEDDPTAGIYDIADGEGAKFYFNNGNLVIDGLTVREKISLHGIDGRHVDANVSYGQGNAMIGTSSLAPGVYVAKCGNASFKFIRK